MNFAKNFIKLGNKLVGKRYIRYIEIHDDYVNFNVYGNTDTFNTWHYNKKTHPVEYSELKQFFDSVQKITDQR